MKERLLGAIKTSASGYRGLILLSLLAAVAYSAYVFRYIEFDNHTLEVLLSQAYGLGEINHRKRYMILYTLTYLLVGVLRIHPYPALVAVVFLYFAFLSFVILLWANRFLSKPLHKLFFFCSFFLLFPSQIGTFLTKDNNLSYYGIFLLSLLAVAEHRPNRKGRLLAGLTSGLAASSYVLFNFLSVAGAIFFFWGKSRKDKWQALFLLGLMPLTIYKGLAWILLGAAGDSWKLSDFWHRNFLQYGSGQLLGMFADYQGGLYWNFGGNLLSVAMYAFLFAASIYVFLRYAELSKPSKIFLMAALGACNGFTFLMVGPAQDHWGPLCIILWCIFLIGFEKLEVWPRRLAVAFSLIFFAQSIAVLIAEREETFIGFTKCQVHLLRSYAEDERQFEAGAFDSYVFPLAYLPVSNYIVMRWPDLRHKMLFTAGGGSFYQPVVNVFRSKPFHSNPLIRKLGLNAPNNLSGEEYLYFQNPEALELLKVAPPPEANSYHSAQIGQELCRDSR